MKDCALIFPKASMDSPTKSVALAIFYPGANLESHGFEVEYADERFESEERVFEICKNAEIVGVSSMTGSQLHFAKRVLRKVKEYDSKIPTILGGVHASLLPEQSVMEPGNLVDFAIVGEGEETMLELVREIKKGATDFRHVKGIAFKDKEGKAVVTERRPFMDPADWPFPMTDKNRKYWHASAKNDDLFYPSSRGCPHRCRFCYNTVYNCNTWRPMPLEKFEREMDTIVAECHPKFVSVADDNISRRLDRIEGVGRVMKKHGIAWHTSIRCDYVNDERAGMLDKYGCTGVLLGIESGSNRVLRDVVGKDYANGVEDIKSCTRVLAKTNISGFYSFMCNTPTETQEELHASMELADWIRETDKKARISFFVYAPYPGTALYHYALENGFVPPQDFEGWSKITMNNPVNPLAEGIYYIAGLHFRGAEGDKTNKNFPGWKRAIIAPFEASANLRWKKRYIKHYGFEKAIVKRLFEWASSRVSKDVEAEVENESV